MTDFKRRRSASASTPDADSSFAGDVQHTRAYVPPEQPFSSATPADPDAQPVFTNEEAWLPDFDEADSQAVLFGDAPYDDAEALPQPAENAFDEDMLTDEELQELHQTRWALLAGLWDFLSVIVGAAFILVLVAMLFSLLNWLISNVTETISLFQTGL